MELILSHVRTIEVTDLAARVDALENGRTRGVIK
jgi:hypothetical protein